MDEAKNFQIHKYGMSVIIHLSKEWKYKISTKWKNTSVKEATDTKHIPVNEIKSKALSRKFSFGGHKMITELKILLGHLRYASNLLLRAGNKAERYKWRA